MNGKQLRNSILQWAIQGKLVPQDPNDEPASVLLERIREEKARLVKEKKIKRDKNESIIYRGDDNSYYEKFIDGKVICIDDEIPFDLPHSWKWTRLGNVFELRSGQDFPPEKYNDKSKGIPYITGASNIDGNSIIQNRWTEYPSVLAPKGCLLLVCKGSGVGKMCYMSLPQAHIARQIQAIIPFTPNLTIEFLRIAIECRLNEITSQANGVIPGIAREATLHFLLPIPPLKEQNRIVEKIKEIDPLVSKYSKCEQELEYINSSISSLLRKSILQEAIQGRLVEQSETDEPASGLLEQIKAEKEKLVKAGLLKKSVLQDTVIFKGDDNKYFEKRGKEIACIDDEIPFEIPDSWEWVRFGSLINMRIGKTPPRGDVNFWSNGTTPWISISDMSDYGIIKHTKEQVSDFAIKTAFASSIVPAGTLIMSFKLTVGRTSILDIDAVHNEAIISIKPYVDSDDSLRDYLFYILPLISNFGDSKDAIKGKTLNSTSLFNLLIPLPPLAEQRRIVNAIIRLWQVL